MKPGVRFGGFRGPRGYVFELTGGALCLDLANTMDERRSAAPRELLASYDDLAGWGEQAGAIPRAAGRRRREEASRDPRAARRALAEARAAREELFALFATVAEGKALPGPLLEAVSVRAAAALARRRLSAAGRAAAWAWPDTPDPERILWPVLASAAELLTGGELDRVRRCEGDRCAWLFLDRSRNASRRWCDMSVCGNRVKARRHYARSREER